MKDWTKQRHGIRKEAEVIEYLNAHINFASIGDATAVVMDEIYEVCATKCGVHKSTCRRWWLSYEQYGEMPSETKEYEKKMSSKWLPKNAAISVDELIILRGIVDKRPEAYLDEIALSFGRRTGKFFRPSTIWKYMSNYLHYTLQALTAIAKQQDEMKRDLFKIGLEARLQEHPEMLILVDETHKDRNAARRRRGWGARNSSGLKIKQWYKNVVRYTLIAAADINGFIACACETVDRNEISNEGAAGTVDMAYFVGWVKEKLCPTLGSYVLGEPRSVVLLDNASTHMSLEVVNAIHATGAVIIYAAPFSPDLNPSKFYIILHFPNRMSFPCFEFALLLHSAKLSIVQNCQLSSDQQFHILHHS